MDIMTKVRVLWEKVAGITADVSAVDAKATATAATLAGILPRIPADYSTEEVNTGRKWIDEKDIYCKVLSGTTSEDTGNETIGNINFDTIVSMDLNLKRNNPSDAFIYLSAPPLLANYVSGNFLIPKGTNASYLSASYVAIIYYTKPDPVPAQADNETRKRKTTKKEEK